MYDREIFLKDMPEDDIVYSVSLDIVNTMKLQPKVSSINSLNVY